MLKPTAHFSSHALPKGLCTVSDFMCVVWWLQCPLEKVFDLYESAWANETDWEHLKPMCEEDVMQELFMCSDNSTIGSVEHTHMHSLEFTEGHECIERQALDVMT